MKQLLRSKYLNHQNTRRKVEREEIDSDVELQSRESKEEVHWIAELQDEHQVFFTFILNIERFVFERETIFTDLLFFLFLFDI